MKLYELTDAYRAVAAVLDENGGELTPELEAELAAIDDAIEAKVDAIGVLIREADAEQEALMAEQKRIMARRQAATNRAQRLKDYVLREMGRQDRDKIKGQRFSFCVAQASTPLIAWRGDGDIPERYVRIITDRKIDRDKVIEDFREGVLPEGFEVKHTSYVAMR